MSKLFISIAVLGIAFTSCNKDDDPVPNPDGSFPECIELSGTQSTAITLTNHVTDPSVPDYCISGDYFVEADLTIEPGVYVRMKNGSRIHVRNNGSFNSEGTANSKITIKGENNIDAGQWENIHFSTMNANNQLVHTNISGGGNSSTYDGMVFIGHQGHASIENCYVSLSSTNGIKTESSTSSLGGISGCTISACGLYPIEVNSRQVEAIAVSNIGGGNGTDKIEVRSLQLQSPATWSVFNFPLHINGVLSIASDLTIEPNVDCSFAADARMEVTSNGSLNCIGTPTGRISFRGDEQTPGFWTGVVILFSTNPQTEFEYCDFSYGGNGSNYQGMITLWGGSNVTVGNSSFSHSQQWGLYRSGGTNIFNDNGNNSWNDNASGDFN